MGEIADTTLRERERDLAIEIAILQGRHQEVRDLIERLENAGKRKPGRPRGSKREAPPANGEHVEAETLV